MKSTLNWKIVKKHIDFKDIRKFPKKISFINPDTNMPTGILAYPFSKGVYFIIDGIVLFVGLKNLLEDAEWFLKLNQ